MAKPKQTEVKVKVPTTINSDVEDAFAELYGYQAEVLSDEGELIPNPVSRADFANERIQDFVVQTVAGWRASKAADEARRISMEQTRAEIDG